MSDAIERAADALWTARRDLVPIPPIRETFGLTTIEEAYAVQERQTERWLAAGRRLSGRKIGLTSKAVQAQIGVDQPDFGVLWADYAFTDGETIDTGRFMQPRVEAEFAFVVDRDVDDPEISLQGLVSSLAYALPSVEIVDSAIVDWKIGLVDTVADNASGGGYALGGSPLRIDGFDFRLAGMQISRNGVQVSIGVGVACLGHPFLATLWLARKMAALGRPLRAGDLVLSGALGPFVHAAPGDVFCVEIAGAAPLNFAFSR